MADPDDDFRNTAGRDMDFWDMDEPGVFDDPDALAAADARALADLDDGRVIGTPAVMHWLAAWGTDAPFPPTRLPRSSSRAP